MCILIKYPQLESFCTIFFVTFRTGLSYFLYMSNIVTADAAAKTDIHSMYVFTSEKSGMGGFDRQLQEKVVFDLSKGSAHFELVQLRFSLYQCVFSLTGLNHYIFFFSVRWELSFLYTGVYLVFCF